MGPRACYDESKRVGETLCYIYNNYYNLHTNIIRPFNVYGPGMNQKDYRIFPNFISNIINGKKINVYGSGNQTRTYCYITDALEGFLRVLYFGKPGEVYNIGNNKPITLGRFISSIESSTGVKAKKNLMPMQLGDVPETHADIDELIHDIGFKPSVSIEEGIGKFVHWYQEIGKHLEDN